MSANPDFTSFFKEVKAKCDKCNSKKLLLFVETRIKDCVAWACMDCQNFQVRAKPETLDLFFKNQNESK